MDELEWIRQEFELCCQEFFRNIIDWLNIYQMIASSQEIPSSQKSYKVFSSSVELKTATKSFKFCERIHLEDWQLTYDLLLLKHNIAYRTKTPLISTLMTGFRQNIL